MVLSLSSLEIETGLEDLSLIWRWDTVTACLRERSHQRLAAVPGTLLLLSPATGKIQSKPCQVGAGRRCRYAFDA